MISLEDLDALDLVLWLQRGEGAARRLGCDQSTVSRRASRCLKTLGLQLQRNLNGSDGLRGDPQRMELLQMQREVHQQHRLMQGRGLRIDASLLAAPFVEQPEPQGWILGDLNGLGWQRPLQLLQMSILDAWITAMGHELPNDKDSPFFCMPLLGSPLVLAAEQGHPLLGEKALSPRDLQGFERVAPRVGRYPRTEALLGDWRLHRPALPLECSRERRREPPKLLPLEYGTGFSLEKQTRLSCLDLNLHVMTELTLVIRRDLVEKPAMAQLIEKLQQRSHASALGSQSSLVLTP